MASDHRLDELIRAMSPPKGTRLWFGGASPVGCLRGVTVEVAARRLAPDRHSIWEFALHIAYWKYAVRRVIEDLPTGSFPRSPSNWPKAPETASEKEWREDRALLRSEHEALVQSVQRFEPRRLDDQAPGSGAYRYIDLMHGAIMHDAYHVGQIQLVKRLFAERSVTA